jgi:hypothetical protein
MGISTDFGDWRVRCDVPRCTNQLELGEHHVIAALSALVSEYVHDNGVRETDFESEVARTIATAQGWRSGVNVNEPDRWRCPAHCQKRPDDRLS